MKIYSAIIGCIILLFAHNSILSQDKKFTHEIMIDCQQVESAKMTSDGTIYGKVKNIDIVFPFRTYINPEKGAEIILSANGYQDYKLVIIKGVPEDQYKVVFTPEVQKNKKNNIDTSEKKAKRKITFDYPITIVCDQIKSARRVGWHQDITFPYHLNICQDLGAHLVFRAPGYENFKLVIPPGTNQHEFRIHFTEDPKEMAKINRNQATSHRETNTQYAKIKLKKAIETILEG